MTSPRQIAANRRNAQASTGPKTSAGKARVARNARSHGLTQSARGDPQWARAVADLARAITGPDASVESCERADRIAAAQADVLRVRQARSALFSGARHPDDLAKRLASIDDYERRALSRRKFAIRHYEATQGSGR